MVSVSSSFWQGFGPDLCYNVAQWSVVRAMLPGWQLGLSGVEFTSRPMCEGRQADDIRNSYHLDAALFHRWACDGGRVGPPHHHELKRAGSGSWPDVVRGHREPCWAWEGSRWQPPSTANRGVGGPSSGFATLPGRVLGEPGWLDRSRSLLYTGFTLPDET